VLGNLTEVFESERVVKRGPTCGITKILAALEADDAGDAAIVRGWLADPDVQHTHIARTLTRVGYPVRAQMVGWHRRGQCQCDEPAVG
jgi:hypothetical protein